MIESTTTRKQRALLATTYTAGLRVSEVVRLRRRDRLGMMEPRPQPFGQAEPRSRLPHPSRAACSPCLPDHL